MTRTKARILAIDTASSTGSIALVEAEADSGETVVLKEVVLESTDGFAHVVFGEIEGLLARQAISLSDIGAFAAASGPGSFTGVRVGLTAAKGLAEATGRGVVAVSNLQAVASFGTAAMRAVAMDARRGEIYGAVYDAELNAVSEEVVITWEAWLARIAPILRLESGGERRSREFITSGLRIDDFHMGEESVMERVIEAPKALAGAIGKIAMGRFRAGLAEDPVQIDANYVRRSDAELLWKES